MSGMYQVVHRFETISTTTAVVPRSVEQADHSPTRSGKYTPLGALASLQPGGAPPTQQAPPSQQDGTPYQTAHPFQPGYFQPAGPLIRPVSPTAAPPTAPPPTATVQPTVVTASSRPQPPPEFSPSEKSTPTSSPVKPTPHTPSTPTTTVGAGAYHPYYGYAYPPPPPAHVGAPQFYPQFPAVPHHPAPHAYPYDGYARPPHYPGYYPPQTYPQSGGYYLAAPAALPYHPATTSGSSQVALQPPPMVPMPNVSSSSQPPVALPGSLPGAPGSIPGAPPHPNGPTYFYSAGYSYPYGAAPPPPPRVPSHQTSVFSYSVQQVTDPSKNVQAGSQVVGEGPGSDTKSKPTPESSKHKTPKKSELKKSETDRRSILPKPEQPSGSQVATILPMPMASTSVVNSLPKSVVVSSGVSTVQDFSSEVTSGAQDLSKNTSEIKPDASKSTLRDYRKPKKPQPIPLIKPKHSLPHDTVITPITASTSSAIGSRKPEGPATVTVFPITAGKPPPAKKAKYNNNTTTSVASSTSVTSSASGSYQLPKRTSSANDLYQLPKRTSSCTSSTSSSYQLPKGLTITVNSTGSKSTNTATTSSNGYNVQMLPVLHIPEYPKKKNHVSATGGVGNSGSGHPGMPNGLLKMTEQLHQRTNNSSNNKVATKITAKDPKSQLALLKMGLIGLDGSLDHSQPPDLSDQTVCLDASPAPYSSPPRLQREEGVPIVPRSRAPTSSKFPPTITASMAASAASAVPVFKPIIPLPKKSLRKSSSVSPLQSKMAPKKQSKMTDPKMADSGSEPSSRSSSRNSSLSPRERTNKTPQRMSPSPKAKGACSLKRKPLLSPVLHSSPPLVPWCKRNKGPAKGSNGWEWVGEPTEQKIYLSNEEPPTPRLCYSAMRHSAEGDVIRPRDCIVLASGNRKKDLPFIAKVTALWESPEDGAMMMSVLWYYRLEHLENRRADDLRDEIYASKHRDHTSVACIEDKCYVMTFNEYCRYRKFLRMVDQGVTPPPTPVPDPPTGYDRGPFLPTCRVAPDRVFLCRRVYESRQRRLLKNPV